jgi:type VII secretion integral membrane protein EccD
MATRFTRVTVLADERSLDVSLPADRPVLELLPRIRDLLSLPPQTNGAWALSAISTGAIDQRRSLDEAGVIDADVLYLTPPQEAPAPPVVDDVTDEVQSTLDDNGSEWLGDSRAYGAAALAAIALLAATLAVPSLPLTAGGLAALLADLGISAAIAGLLLRDRGGDLLVAAAIPAWTLAGFELAHLAGWAQPAPFAAALAGAGIGCAALGLTGDRWTAVAAGGVAVVPFGVVATVLAATDLGLVRAAAASAVLAVFGAGLAPQFAVGRARLVDMLRAEENGEQTGRDELARSIRRGQATLTGAVTGIAVVAAISAAALLASRHWAGIVLGAAVGVVFALRSRAFTRTGQVLPMLAPPVVAAVFAALAVPSWLGAPAVVATAVAFGGPLAVILLLIIVGRPRADEVGAARLRQFFDFIELIAVLALVPLAVAAFNGFAWASS